jgi:sortase A
MMKFYQKLEGLLLAAGLVLLLLYVSARFQGLVMSRAGVISFNAHQAHPQTADTSKGQQPTRSNIDFSLWSEKRIRAYQTALGMKVEPPLAVISIAKLGLEVPVYEGTDEFNLNRGAGWILGTARPGEAGNIGIAAHRDGFFRGLKDIHEGDQIKIAAPSGDYLYKVDQIEIVDPSNTSVLKKRSRPSLTLVTCYPFYFVGDAPQRFIVHASLVDPVKVGATELNSPGDNGERRTPPR